MCRENKFDGWSCFFFFLLSFSRFGVSIPLPIYVTCNFQKIRISKSNTHIKDAQARPIFCWVYRRERKNRNTLHTISNALWYLLYWVSKSFTLLDWMNVPSQVGRSSNWHMRRGKFNFNDKTTSAQKVLFSRLQWTFSWSFQLILCLYFLFLTKLIAAKCRLWSDIARALAKVVDGTEFGKNFDWYEGAFVSYINLEQSMECLINRKNFVIQCCASKWKLN